MILLLRCKYDHGEYAQEEPFLPHGDGIEIETPSMAEALSDAKECGWRAHDDGSATCPYHGKGGGGFRDRVLKVILPPLTFRPFNDLPAPQRIPPE